MGNTLNVGDLAMRIVEKGSFSFTDYSPRGMPGFESDIAKRLGADIDQVGELLRAVDELEEDHHYVVRREVVRQRTSEREVTPEIIRVTITAA